MVDEPQLESGEDAPKITEQPQEVKPNKNKCCQWMARTHEKVTEGATKRSQTIRLILTGILLGAILIFFICATVYFASHKYPRWQWGTHYGYYLIVTFILYVLLLYTLVFKTYLRKKLNTKANKFKDRLKDSKVGKNRRVCLWLFCVIIIAVIVLFFVINCLKEPFRLIALLGYVVILIFNVLLSKHPNHIQAKPIMLCIFFQFLLAFITIRTSFGRDFFRTICDRIMLFQKHSKYGALFTFGVDVVGNFANTFAFEYLAFLYFLAFFTGALYYYEILPKLIFSAGVFFSWMFGTTMIESVNAVLNTFFNLAATPIILKPYLKSLTISELHAVLTAGFGTLSGYVLADYITHGLNPTIVISSLVMSAPTTLSLAKILWPETEESLTTKTTIEYLPTMKAINVLDAVYQSVMDTIDIILGLCAVIVAFVSLIVFLNGLTGFLFDLVGLKVDLILLFTYILMPISYLMGVPWYESDVVARLVAIRIINMDVSAVEELGQVLEGDVSQRTKILATYAISGLGSPISMGMQAVVFKVLCPEQTENFYKCICRALFAGICTSFLTTCLAGMMFRDDHYALDFS